MTDEILESGQGEGSEGTTNSNASQSTGDKRPSQFSAEELLKQLEPLIERKVQSVKDRRFDEQGKRLDELSQFQPVLERFRDLVSPEQLKEIQKDLEFEDLKRRVYGDGQPSAEQSTGNTPPPAVNAAKTFVELGLDVTDPVVAVELQKSYANENDAIAAAWKLSKKLASSPAPTQAQGAALQGGTPAEKDVEALTAEYQTEMANAQGNPSLARSIKAEYAKKGVPVDAVVFH